MTSSYGEEYGPQGGPHGGARGDHAEDFDGTQAYDAGHPGGPEVAARPGEPVAVANTINVLVTALVGAGWVTIDNTTINAILTAIGAIIAVVTTIKARSKVTPTS